MRRIRWVQSDCTCGSGTPKDIILAATRPWWDRFPWGMAFAAICVIALIAFTWAALMRLEVGKKTAALERVNALKSQFLAKHESRKFRTPMNGILGMIRILLDTPLSAEQRDYAETVQGSAESLLRLLNDILDFSKVESGRLEIEMVNFDLAYLLSRTVELMRPVAAEKRLPLILQLPPNVPPAVVGDPTRVRQIISNFLSNAMKFTQQGSITVSLTWNPPTGDDSYGLARISVQDTGIGMSEEQCARMFQRFEQADVSIARQYGGTGLGLAISRSLAELMGGTVGVTSNRGEGSTFWLELRMVVARQEEVEHASTIPVQTAALFGRRILLAEDNRTNQKIALALLKKMGCETTLAENGLEVLAQVRDNGPFDVILMDCQMPEMDGYEASRQLRASGCQLPVIALTAGALNGDRQFCLAAGMDDYLSKPFRPDDLARTISSWIGRKSTRALHLENIQS